MIKLLIFKEGEQGVQFSLPAPDQNRKRIWRE